MSVLGYNSLLAFIIYIILGVYAYKLNKKSKVNQVFLAFCLCFAIWSFPYIFLYDTERLSPLLIWYLKKFATVGWCFYPGIALNLGTTLTGKNIKGAVRKIVLYLPCIIILFLAIYWFPPLVKKTDSLYDLYSIISLLVTLSYIGITIIMIYIWGKKSTSIMVNII